MFIVTHHNFQIYYTSSKIYIKLPENFPQLLKESLIHPNVHISAFFSEKIIKIELYDHVERKVKQVGVSTKSYWIPRVKITLKSGKCHYHRILPDFIIPCCNYTKKSIIISEADAISTEILEEIRKTDYDKVCETGSLERHQKKIKYIKSQFSNYCKRIKMGVFRILFNSFLKNMGAVLAYPVVGAIKKYHFFTSDGGVISPSLYIDLQQLQNS